MHHYVLLINKLMHPFNFSLYFEFFFLKKNGQWVKNEWNEEGGFAGVWIGYVTTDGEKDITHLEWDDLSIEDKHFLFMTEEEEQKYENQRSQIYNPDTTINSPQKIIDINKTTSMFCKFKSFAP